MYTFLDIINVDRTFHYETNFVKKMITTIIYKKGCGNIHECFLRIKFFYYKINIFCCTLWGWGGGESGKAFLLYACENVNNEEQIITSYPIDGAMGHSGGGRVQNNAIVARGILVTNIALWDTRTASAPSILLVLLKPPNKMHCMKYYWQVKQITLGPQLTMLTRQKKSQYKKNSADISKYLLKMIEGFH